MSENGRKKEEMKERKMNYRRFERVRETEEKNEKLYTEL